MSARRESSHAEQLALAFHGQDTWLQWGADGYQMNRRAEMEGNNGMILKQFEEDGYITILVVELRHSQWPGVKRCQPTAYFTPNLLSLRSKSNVIFANHPTSIST